MGLGLRGHFVLGLAPMISIVFRLEPAVHPSKLAPALRKVKRVAPVILISHGRSVPLVPLTNS